MADMDGDGIPEIGVAGASRYTVFRADGSILWGNPVQDYSSAVTASSVFDFDGDGTAEVVYADETRLRVYRGADGSALFETPNSSGTTFEEPVIADVDGDGHADILICANQWTFAPGPNVFHGLRLFSDVNNAWVGTRRIWNQHTYHITNINDDGSVPQVEQNSWQVHNTYRLNARPGVSSTAAPDLSASYIRIQDRGGVQPSTFTVRIGNGGALALDPGIFVAFYNGKPEAGGTLLGAAKTTLGLGSGEYQDIDFSYPGALTGIAELVIVADDDGSGKNAIADFDRTNNRASLLLSALPGSFAIQVATDQAGYGSNSAVAISATVTNAGSMDGNVGVRFLVETADGSINVATLPTTPLAVAKTSSGTVAAAWNTGTTYLGDYRIKAELLDGQGVPFAVATVVFGIGANATPAVAAKITTDKPSYLPTDIVNIAVRVSNLTQNRMLDGLTATTTIYQPGGGVLWSQTAPLAQLPPTAFKDSNYGVNLAMAAAGVYRAALAVQDSAGTTLAQTGTTFTVQSTGDSGSGLKGSVGAVTKQVSQGDALLINSTVTNLGNAAATALPMTLSIVDPVNQTVLASWPYTVDLAQGGTYQGVQTWKSGAGKVNATYMAVLTASVGGKTLTLGYDTFTVIESPVKLDVKQQILREGRLLVLLTCRNGEGGGHERSVGLDRQGTAKQEDGAQNDDGQDDKSCLAGRSQIMDSALNTLGIAHRISTTLADFKQAFRSGQYNLYWLSGGALKLDNTLALEIREAVHRGDGLLVEGAHDERNKLLDEIVGVTYRGKLAGANQPIILGGTIFTTGKIADTQGQALKFVVNGGIQQARFLANLPCNDCEDGDGRASDSLPAIVSNSYGQGKSLIAAFDFMGALLNAPTGNTTWQEITQSTFGYLIPNVPESHSGGAYAVARTALANQGKAVKLEAGDTLPTGGHIVATRPQAQTDSTGSQAKWTFDLDAGQSANLDLSLRLPGSSGSYTLATLVNRLDNGLSVNYGSYPLTFPVSVATEPANRAKLINDLQALNLKAKRDREARDQTVKSLLESQRNLDQGKVEDAIGNLLDAVDKLRSLVAIDPSALRLQIDRQLQEIEFIWQPPARKTDGKAATTTIGSR